MSEKYRKKVKVAVIFGGYSSEYSVSLESSSAVIKNLDPEKYEVLPVGITKEDSGFLIQAQWKILKMIPGSSPNTAHRL